MYNYVSKLTKVVDGDTVDLMVDLGFNVYNACRFRLSGINSAEMTGINKDAGKLAKAHLEALLADATDGNILVESHGKDKYGRWLATLRYVSLSTKALVNANDQMVSDGFAVVYMP